MKMLLTQLPDGDAPAVPLEVRRTEAGWEVVLDGKTWPVTGSEVSPGVYQLTVDGRKVRIVSSRQGEIRQVAEGSRRHRFRVQDPALARRRARTDTLELGSLTSSMPGQVLKILVEEGIEVARGQALIIVEAMKMEHEIKAPSPGRIRSISCQVGGMVSPGVPLIELEPI